MAGVFDTSDVGETQSSPITVKAGVAEPANQVAAFLGGSAWGAYKEGTTQAALEQQEESLEDIQSKRNEELGAMRLNALNDKFDALSVGMTQGLPTAQANARARAALAEAKASVPWIGKRADDSFKAFFGGSAGGFEPSPLEKAAAAHQEKVAATAAALGVSLREANMVVQTEAQNAAATQVLEQRKLSQEGNEGAFRDFTNTTIQSSTVQAQTILKGHLAPGSNVLKPEAMASVNASISTLAANMRTKIREQAFKADGTPYLTEDAIKARFDEVDVWEKQQKALVTDRSYLDLMNTIRDTGAAELAVASHEMFPVFKIADEAGGQVLVADMIKGMQDSRYVATLVARNPQLAKLFTEDGRVRQLTAAGLSKAFGKGEISSPDSNIRWAAGGMANGGAEASQAFLADPLNAPTTEAAYAQVSSEKPEEAADAMGYHRESGSITPSETARSLNGKVFKNYLRKKPDEGFKVLSSSLEGMSQSFKSAFFTAAQEIPEYVNVSGLSFKDGKTRTAFNISTEGGGTVPEEAKATIAHQYSVLVENPAYVQRFEELMGIPLTPAEVVEIMVNDKIHPKFYERAAEQKEAGTFKGFPKREDERILENLSLGGKMLRFWNAPRIPPKAIAKKEREAMVDPAKSQMEEIFGAPKEPEVPTLTQEQVDEIKALPTLEEKKAKALEYGLPQEMIDAATRGR